MKNKRIRIIVIAIAAIALLAAGYFLFLRPAGPEGPLKGKVILLAGDSRSSTDYTFYKEILEKKTGTKVLVEGASGCLTAYNASNEYFERLKQKHDFSIWLVGGNDEGSKGTIGTFSAESEKFFVATAKPSSCGRIPATGQLVRIGTPLSRRRSPNA